MPERFILTTVPENGATGIVLLDLPFAIPEEQAEVKKQLAAIYTKGKDDGTPWGKDELRTQTTGGDTILFPITLSGPDLKPLRKKRSDTGQPRIKKEQAGPPKRVRDGKFYVFSDSPTHVLPTKEAAIKYLGDESDSASYIVQGRLYKHVVETKHTLALVS